MAYKLHTAATTEPVALAEAKRHLVVDHCEDDATIRIYLKAAREKVEADCHRQLVTATWTLTLDKFPYEDRGTINLEVPPVQSVALLSYIDEDGDSQTLSSSDYQLDTYSEPARLRPAYDECWPSTRCQMNAVTVRFIAGYGAASAVPAAAKEAILLLVAHWYENREAVGQVGREIELAYGSLIKSLRWH